LALDQECQPVGGPVGPERESRMTFDLSNLCGEPANDPSIAARDLLNRNFLFRELPAAVLDRISAQAQWRACGRNEIIFSQGDAGDALFGVVSGRVRISATSPDGREVFLNIMEPGDSFGEIAVIDGLPRTAGLRRDAVEHGGRQFAEQKIAIQQIPGCDTGIVRRFAAQVREVECHAALALRTDGSPHWLALLI
jgi:hypothetical protein